MSYTYELPWGPGRTLAQPWPPQQYPRWLGDLGYSDLRRWNPGFDYGSEYLATRKLAA